MRSTACAPARSFLRQGHVERDGDEHGGGILGAAKVVDPSDHTRLPRPRFISNPPGNTARIHQHLRLGDGDVDWDAYCAGLAATGFFDRDDSILVSNVFAENEAAAGVSRFQLPTNTQIEATRSR